MVRFTAANKGQASVRPPCRSMDWGQPGMAPGDETMLDNLRIRLALRAAQPALKRCSGVVHINDALRTPRALVVFFPRETEELAAAERETARLASALGVVRFLLVRYAPTVRHAELVGTSVEWSDDDIGLFLPKRQASRRVLAALSRGKPADIAVDLNRRFCLPTAYWTAKSEARLRIGFKTAWSGSFFNLEYQPRNPDAPAQLRYRGLVNFVLSLAGRLEA